jgi:hypothetical protein
MHIVLGRHFESRLICERPPFCVTQSNDGKSLVIGWFRFNPYNSGEQPLGDEGQIKRKVLAGDVVNKAYYFFTYVSLLIIPCRQ